MDVQVNPPVALFELPNGNKITVDSLRRLLPTTEIALFFGKAYKLNAYQLGDLLRTVFNSSLIEALTDGEHSTELQDYIVDLDLVAYDRYQFEAIEVTYSGDAPEQIAGELLPQMWKMAEVEIAKSIADVAAKLSGTLSHLPSKQGSMVFQTLMQVNRNRPVIGDYRASIKHMPVPDVLVILDVSGSMTEHTVRTIISDVVALSWEANAHLVIVSNHAYHWEPGSYDVDSVLEQAEYGGTYYEQLVGMLDRDWGTVVTIADYDSSRDAKRAIAMCKGRIGKVLDISLVNRPTFLAECVGQLAEDVQPLMIASPRANLTW